MTWFNLEKDLNKKRKKMEEKFLKELEQYYTNIKNLNLENSRYISPDIDEVKELKKELKEHPENIVFGKPIIEGENSNFSELYLDPLNPVKIITRKKNRSKPIMSDDQQSQKIRDITLTRKKQSIEKIRILQNHNKQQLEEKEVE